MTNIAWETGVVQAEAAAVTAAAIDLSLGANAYGTDLMVGGGGDTTVTASVTLTGGNDTALLA